MRRIIIVALGSLAVAAITAPVANAGLLTKAYDTVDLRGAVGTVAWETGIGECTSDDQPDASSSECVIGAGDAAVTCSHETTQTHHTSTFDEFCGATVGDTTVGCERQYDTWLSAYTSTLECGTEALHVHEFNHQDPEGGTATNEIEVHAGDQRVAEIPVPLPPSP